MKKLTQSGARILIGRRIRLQSGAKNGQFWRLSDFSRFRRLAAAERSVTPRRATRRFAEQAVANWALCDTTQLRDVAVPFRAPKVDPPRKLAFCPHFEASPYRAPQLECAVRHGVTLGATASPAVPTCKWLSLTVWRRHRLEMYTIAHGILFANAKIFQVHTKFSKFFFKCLVVDWQMLCYVQNWQWRWV
jgi:hypothetical protein